MIECLLILTIMSISVLIHAFTVFEIAILDVGILKEEFVKGCFAYSIADSESEKQQNRLPV